MVVLTSGLPEFQPAFLQLLKVQHRFVAECRFSGCPRDLRCLDFQSSEEARPIEISGLHGLRFHTS